MSRLHAIGEAVLQQHCDPVAFLERQQRYPGRVYWPAWRLRMGLFLVVLALIVLAAQSSRQPWPKLVGLASLAPLALLIAGMLPSMATWQVQFALLEAFSPLALAVALAWGLAPLSPLCKWVGTIGFMFALGGLVSGSCVLWVHRQLGEIGDDHRRMRAGGLAAELPALALWRRVRLVRLATAAGISLVVLLAFADGRLALAVVVGGLHLELSLLAWLCRWPLLRWDRRRGRWRVTYGRLVMFIPVERVRSALAPAPAECALALLEQGGLAPAVRRAVRELPLAQAHRLAFELSLQAGGAEAIRYLAPAWPARLGATAACYAALATQAARPLDLQRWISLLATPLPPPTEMALELEADPLQALSLARDALLAFSSTPGDTPRAIQSMRQLVHALYRERETWPRSWPVALLYQLESHPARLEAG